MGLITLSTPPVLARVTGTCNQYKPRCVGDTQKALFYTGMAIIAVASAAQEASWRSLIERNELHPTSDEDTRNIRSFKDIVIILTMSLTTAIGFFSFPYIKNWSLLFGISTLCMAVAAIVFFGGYFLYNRPPPEGGILSMVLRVFVAAAFKILQPYPEDTGMLYQGNNQSQITPTRSLRFMDKAAIILPGDDPENKTSWRLCSLAEVEYAKFIVRTIPLWATFVICGTVSSIGNTYFVEQGSHMNRKLGIWKVPSQVLLAIFYLGKKMFSLLATNFGHTHRRYGPVIVIAMSMIFATLCCVAAAVVETQRLKAVRSHGLLDKPDVVVPMSAYWLFFQFFLLAGVDAFFETNAARMIRYQAPLLLGDYLSFIYKFFFGLGYLYGVLSVYVVGEVSEKVTKTSWMKDTLNRSRLDRYYWVLTVMSSVNLLVFLLLGSCYRFRNWELQEDL